MRNLDFSSLHGLLTTLLGLVTLMGVGVRLLAIQLIQQRRERENGQINERLCTLIAAYKTLGGSFTGDLAVDPTHLCELRNRAVSSESHSLRDFVRKALDLDAIPVDLAVPKQGPTRPGAGGGNRGKGQGGKDDDKGGGKGGGGEEWAVEWGQV